MVKISKKKIDKLVNDLFKEVGNYKQFKMTDLPQISKSIELELLANNLDIDKTRIRANELIELYRLK